MGRCASVQERDGDPTSDAKVGARAVAPCATGHRFARTHRVGLPRDDAKVPQARRRIGAGKGNDGVALELDAPADDRHFERCGTVVVTHEAISDA